MQDTHTNRLLAADSLEELREKVPPKHRGPTFVVGEVVRIKGYYYRVEGLAPDRLTFAPHGRSKKGHAHKDDGEAEYRPRRRGQKR